MILLTGAPVFATGFAQTKKHTSVKQIHAKGKKTYMKKSKSTEKRPVPKVSIKNPLAIYDN